MRKTNILSLCLMAIMFQGVKASYAQAFENEKSVASIGYGFGTFLGAVASNFEDQEEGSSTLHLDLCMPNLNMV